MRERRFAAHLGYSAVEISKAREYERGNGVTVDIRREVARAVNSKESVPPDEVLSIPETPPFESTRVQLVNDTTLAVARGLVEED